MSDRYLWDRTGPPDPEVVRLEALLGELGYRAGAPPFAAAAPPARRPWRRFALGAAAAAALALVPWLVSREAPSSWAMTVLDADGGRPRPEELREGDWLVTGDASRARLEVGMIGRVEVEPRTRVRLVDAGRGAHRLALDRGRLHARIWAPPGTFFVDTPSAVAVDLGCEYSLEVDDEGAGRLRVRSGWVGFERHGREAFVPAGAACLTRPAEGPGTPHYEDAPPRFVAALAILDFGGDGPARARALAVVLQEARRRDALSLWHLLARAPEDERGRLFDGLAGRVPPPPGVTREGVRAGEADMLDAWWDALELGSAGFWRLWHAPGPPRARGRR